MQNRLRAHSSITHSDHVRNHHRQQINWKPQDVEEGQGHKSSISIQWVT